MNKPQDTRKKYCRFKKNGIKYVDYKDPNFLLKFVNEQGRVLPPPPHRHQLEIPAQSDPGHRQGPPPRPDAVRSRRS